MKQVSKQLFLDRMRWQSLGIKFFIVLVFQSLLLSQHSLGQVVPLGISYENMQFQRNVQISEMIPSIQGITQPPPGYKSSVTLAGNGTSGDTDGAGEAARFNNPSGITIDAAGNTYVADRARHIIRKITPDGTVSTLAGTKGTAGNTDGALSFASFRNPEALIIDSTGMMLYVVDRGNHRIRLINLQTSQVSTIAGSSAGFVDGNGTTVRFRDPAAIIFDNAGALLVADQGNHRIRKITNNDGTWVTTTIAGSGTAGTTDGAALTARITNPAGLALGKNGELYISTNKTAAFLSAPDFRIRKLVNGQLTTLAGTGEAGFDDGVGTEAKFNEPRHMVVDRQGNLLVADAANHSIRIITPEGEVNTFLGSLVGKSGNQNASGTGIRFNLPVGLAFDQHGNLYISEFDGQLIKKVSLDGFELNGNLPLGLSFDSTNGKISGTPIGFSLKTLYQNDFDYGELGQTKTANPKTPVLSESAMLESGRILLTPAVNSKRGGLTIPASGINSGELRVDFELITGNDTGGASGISYSFSPEGQATDGTPNPEIGTGSGLSLSFNTEDGGVKLYYGTNKGVTSIVGTSGLIAFTNQVHWRGKKVHVSMTIFENKVTVSLEGEVVFDQVALPATYATANKSSWYHVFKARTSSGFFGAALNDVHAIDRLSISHGLGLSEFEVTAYNANGSAKTKFEIRVGDLPEIASGNVTDVKFNSAKTSYKQLFDGNGSLTEQGILLGSSADLAVGNSLALLSVNLIIKENDVLLTQLLPETTYFVRAFITNEFGTGYGEIASFTTPIAPPNISMDNSKFELVRGVSFTTSPTNSGGGIPVELKHYVSTYAGTVGVPGFKDGSAQEAQFSLPIDLAIDGEGNIFVSDESNNSIRKIDTEGNVSTIAGTGTAGFKNGPGSTAQFRTPAGIALDQEGNIYLSDLGNHVIRKINIDGVVSTAAGTGQGPNGFKDGKALESGFHEPEGLEFDPSGILYIADKYNNRIRKLDKEGNVSTFLGSSFGHRDGERSQALIKSPLSVFFDNKNNLYFTGGNSIRKVDSKGQVSTLANLSFKLGFRDGFAPDAWHALPSDGVVDPDGSLIFIDARNHAIRKIDTLNMLTTLNSQRGELPRSGFKDGMLNQAQFFNPGRLAIDKTGDIYLTDVKNHVIRKISATGWSISPDLPEGMELKPDGTIVGTPLAVVAPKEYTITATNISGTSAYTFELGVAELGLSKLTFSNGILGPEFDQNTVGYSMVLENEISSISFLPEASVSYAQIYWSIGEGEFTRITSGNNSPEIDLREGKNVLKIKVKSEGVLDSALYTINIDRQLRAPKIQYGESFTFSTNQEIDTVEVQNSGGEVTPSFLGVITLAGNGVGGSTDGYAKEASIGSLRSVAINSSGEIFFVNGNKIRKLDTVGYVSTFAGSDNEGLMDGFGDDALFALPVGIAFDNKDNLYVADYGNQLIRKVTPDRNVTSFAGPFPRRNNKLPQLAYTAVTEDNFLYVSEGNVLYKLNLMKQTNVAQQIGTNNTGFVDGIIPSFDVIGIISSDKFGNIYISDVGNSSVRKLDPSGSVSTIGGSPPPNRLPGLQDGINSLFYLPQSAKVDSYGNVYVIDGYQRNVIRKISKGTVSTIIPDLYGYKDGTLGEAQFKNISDIALDSLGNIIVLDEGNSRIRKITLNGWSVSPSLPKGLKLNEDGSITGTPTEITAAKNYVVTAKNAGGEFATTVRIEVTAGATAGLKNLVIDAGKLEPAFSTDDTTYSVAAEGGMNAIAFTATQLFEGSVIEWKFGDGSFSLIASGTPSPSIPLAEGSNLITIRVTSPDTQTSRTYTLNVVKAVSDSSPPAVAGTISGGGILCENDGATVSVSGAQGSIRWEYSTDGINYYDVPFWRTSAGVNTTFVNSNNTTEFTTQSQISGRTYVFTELKTDVYFRVKVLNEVGLAVYTEAVYYRIGSAKVGTLSAAETNVCTGAGTTLTLTGAEGSIQWQEASVSDTGVLGTFKDIKDQNGETLATGNLSGSKAYRAVVSVGSCSEVVGEVAVITVTPAAEAGVTTARIGGKVTGVVAVGENITFTSTGHRGSSLHWEVSIESDTTGFETVLGAMGDSFTLENVGYEVDSKFYVRSVATGSCNSAASAASTIRVVQSAAVAGTIKGGGILCENDRAKVSLSGSKGIISWEYSFDGINYFDAPYWRTSSGVNTTFVNPNNTTEFTTQSRKNGRLYVFAELKRNVYFRARVLNNSGLSVYTEAVYYQIGTAVAGTVSAAESEVCAGSGTTLTLSGWRGSNIQWQEASVSDTGEPGTFKDIKDQNATTFTTGSLSESKAYRALVRVGKCPAVVSDPAVITLTPDALAGVTEATIEGKETGAVTLGGTITFTSFGHEGNSLLWEVSTESATSGFEAVSGATGDSFALENVEYAVDSKFYVRSVSTGSCNSATSTVSTIRVVAPAVAGTINGGGILCENGGATISVSGAEGSISWEYSTDGITYFDAPYWRTSLGINTSFVNPNNTKEFTTQSRKNGRLYRFTGLKSDVYFRAKVLNNSGVGVYTEAVYYRIGQAEAGTISTDETNVCAGEGTKLTLADAKGTVQWQQATVSDSGQIGSFSDISGQTETTFVTGSLSGSMAYRAVVSVGSCSKVTSDAKVITVTRDAVSGVTTATIEGKDTRAVTPGGYITFTSSGHAGSLLQWELSTESATSGFEAVSGATGDSFTLENVRYALGSEFYVRSVSTGICNSAVSAVIKIRVVASAVAGTISGGGILCENDGATVSVSGAEGIIQWEYSTDGISYYDAPYWRTSKGVNTSLFNPNNTVEFTTKSRFGSRLYIFSSLSSDVYFRARVVNNSGLSVYTDAVYYQVVNAGTITGGDVTVCAPLGLGPDNSFTSPITNMTVLTLSNAVGAVIEWQKSTDYSEDPGVTPVWTVVTDLSDTTAVGASYSGAGSGVLVIGNLSSDTWYRAVVREGGCTASSAVVKITVDQASLACVISNSAFRVLETLPAVTNQTVEVQASVEEVEQNEVVAYPNPTKGRFMLDLTGFEKGGVLIRVMESSGKLLYEQEAELPLGRSTVEVNPTERAAGVYFVQVVQWPRMKVIRMIFE